MIASVPNSVALTLDCLLEVRYCCTRQKLGYNDLSVEHAGVKAHHAARSGDVSEGSIHTGTN